jgi:hypothetical protein
VPRVVVGANVGLHGRDEDEEASAMAEDLAGLIVRSATKENLVRMRVLGLWSIKILVVLYLATCLWSVVTALVDAVVRLIAPGPDILWVSTLDTRGMNDLLRAYIRLEKTVRTFGCHYQSQSISLKAV